MKTHKVIVEAEVVTNLPLTSSDVMDALQHMVYSHQSYDRDETVAAIPLVKLHNIFGKETHEADHEES